MKRILPGVILIFCCVFQAMAQERTVSGKVVSSENSTTVPGVAVALKGTTNGTITNEEGGYRINVPAAGGTLVFTFIGMTTEEVVIGDRSVINVTMDPDVTQLSEVVVVGYGAQLETELTGSIAQVKAADLSNIPVPTLESAMQGKAAGVFIEQGSGKPGQAMKVRIRGSSSVTASNQPLYVVDGIPIITESVGISTNEPTNPLADINFNDVESVEVLKDASASAIYGSRASNGVVIITTKRGKSGKTKFDVTFAQGTSTPTHKRSWMNAEQYMEYMNEAYANTAELEGLTEDELTDYYFGIPDKATLYDIVLPGWRDDNDTDWQDKAFQTGSVTEADIAASGGNEKTKFYFGGSYYDQEGILIGNAFNRLSGRLNLDHQASEKLSFSASFSLARSQNDRVANDNAFATPLQLVAMPAVQPVNDPETGELNTNTLYYNGLIEARDAFFQTVVFRNITNLSATYKFMPELSFTSRFGLDMINQDEDGYQGRETQDGAPAGQGTSRRLGFVNYSLDNYFNYAKTLNETHSLDLTLGMNYQKTEQESISVQGEGFPSDDFQRVNDAADIISGSSFGTNFSLLSYFFRANYDYRKKILLSLNGRVDGSSRFGSNNRYGFFPAVSAGYVLSEESFLQDNVAAITFLKLRASYGLTGNAEIGNFDWRGLSGGATYGGDPGLQLTTVSNPDLKWETTAQLDIGVDFGLFNNRLSGAIDVYRKNTTDLLLNVTIPATTGYTAVLQNIGELENKGLEIALTSQNLVGALKWSTTFNIAFNRNKIKNLGKVATGEDRVVTSGKNRAMTGEPIGVFWLTEYAGVDPETGDALWYLNDPEQPADSITNIYGAANPVVAGNPNPDYVGGLTNTFSYKGFDLSVFFQFVVGNDVYNDGATYQLDDAGWFDNKDTKLLQRWQQPGDKTDVPKPYFALGNGADESTRFLYDASYVRLKNVTLGYTLPTSLAEAIKMTRVRIYVTGQNLLTFTDYPGWDPEVNFAAVNPSSQTSNIRAGRDFYTAPQAKTIMAGVNISF